MEQIVKRNKNKNLIRALYLLLWVSFALMAAFAIGIAWELHTNNQGQSFYAEIAVAQMPRPAGGAPAASQGGGTSAVDENDKVSYIDFPAMRESFPDIVAWIQSYGTVINYPIVQGDDNDYYLHHLPDGTKNDMGSIFLDFRNSTNFSDNNILIYGHNMKSGDMFGSLKNYSNQQYYEQHDSMMIFTPDMDYELILISGYVLDSAVETPPLRFNGSEDFNKFISETKNRSIFRSGADAEYGDQLVFLCTCTPGNAKNERLILVGRLEALE